MRILLVNDDGIHSPGISALREVFAEKHEVWTCAPDREKSGASHSITFADPVRTRKVDDKAFAIQGTPADCVLTAFHQYMPEPPDIVVSGINLGANLGADIVYSGTAGAARQAVFLGIPGVAVSLDTFTPPCHFNTAARFVAGNIQDFLQLWLDSGDKTHFLNINVPNVEAFDGSVLIAPPAKLAYENRMVSFSAPRGESYLFYEGNKRLGMEEEVNTDIDLVSDGNIVITPVEVYPVLSRTAEMYAAQKFVTGDGRKGPAGS